MSGRSLRELHDLSGRVALVTGAAGFGFAGEIVEALAEAGASVMLTSRDAVKAEAAAAEFRAHGFAVAGTVMELGEEGSIVAAVAGTVAAFGRLDILVNAAAALCMDAVEAVAIDDFNRTLNANVGGTLAVSRAAAPHLHASGRGAIINLSSIYGVVAPDPRIYGDSGLNSPLVYGASKAAIEQMTRYLAIHWAPTIRVNCIAPGGLSNRQGAEFVERYNYRTPLGRMGAPEDIKGIALYLASDASAWVTGQNFMVDGGWTAW
ncbi:SDR family oxidoreductase [Endothiovibrio diazotrophicus]